MGNLRERISPEQLKNEVLTVQEVARYLRIKPATIYRWIAKGRIKPLYVGSLVRITRPELLRFLALGARRP